MELLYPLLVLSSIPYSALVRARNRLYDGGILPVRRVQARTVSVGNLTVGGTGKTPLVVRTVEEALHRGLRPAVLFRGYKAPPGGGRKLNDEGMLLREAVPEAALFQDPDRLAAARRAAAAGADLLVLDDGFQHRRLGRDVDVVLVDATRPFGFGRVLPAGLLREPVEGFSRAQVIVVTRSNRVSREALEAVEARLARLAPRAPRFRARFVPTRLRRLGGGEAERVEGLAGRRVYCFSGLARPEGFEETLVDLGACIAGRLRFPDHHAYTKGDLERVLDQAGTCGAEVVVTTTKDGVKLRSMAGAEQVRVLEGTMRIQGEEALFWSRIFGDASGVE